MRYRKPDNSQGAKRGFVTKKEAGIFLADVEIAKHVGSYIDPARAKITVGSIGGDWLATKRAHLKLSAYLPIEQGWRLRVLPRWGNVNVRDVEHSGVQAWIDGMMKDGKSASVILRDYGTLIGILDVAVKDQRLPSNRARGVKLPKKGGKARRYLSHQQVQLLVDAIRDGGGGDVGAGPVGATFVTFLAYTGNRWGEAAGLRVRSIDFARARFVVEENAVQIARKIHVGTPKSGESRSVAIPGFLLEELQTLVRGRKHGDLVFGDGGAYITSPNIYNGWFARGVQTAMLADPTFPKITPHDLRHTAASLAVSAGANVKALQRMLGHKSAAMTLDIYADLFEDDLDDVAIALNQARFRSVVSNPRPSDPVEPAS